MRISVVFDSELAGWTEADHWYHYDQVIPQWKTEEPAQEYQVAFALREKGHNVSLAPIVDDPSEFLQQLRQQSPDVVFNCTESFRSIDRLDFVVPALLEAESICYTGAPPAALMMTRNKGLSKKVLAHHGVYVPDFSIFRPGETPSKKFEFPVIVKPLKLDGSYGISQASLVNNDEELFARVDFVHERFSEAAIVEQFVVGRELYTGVIGNGDRLKVLPATEMIFADDASNRQQIATRAAKWDENYRARRGISNEVAHDLPQEVKRELKRIAKVAFRMFWLRDYARLDVRLDAEGQLWVIEANANPYLSRGHEMCIAAEEAGMRWTDFIDKIVKTARRRFKLGTK